MCRRVVRLWALFGALAVAISGIGCGGDPSQLTSASVPSSTETMPAASPASGSAAPSTAPTPTPTPSGPTPPNPSAASFDTYPSSATVTSNMQNAAWNSCNCGGTGAEPSSQSLSHTGSDSARASISGSGSGVSGWLWWSKLAGINANHWIMEYDVTPTKLAGAAALEFDGNQTGSLGNYVFGTECNYGYNPTMKTVWRFWTMSGGSETWGTTKYACPITQVNHTYRVQTHFVVSGYKYQVVRLKVTDLTAGSVLQDDRNLGTFSAVGSHGDSIDIQLDAAGSSTVSADYRNITVTRWFE